MRIVILMLAALLVVTGIGCGATRGPKVPAGATAGAWDGKCEAGLFNTCTSQEAADALDVADVWCRWQGPDVIVHVAMHSHFSARLKVAVIPRTYKTTAPTALLRPRPIPHYHAATRVFDINAGRPSRIAGRHERQVHPETP